jgi:hypothetical protein
MFLRVGVGVRLESRAGVNNPSPQKEEHVTKCYTGLQTLFLGSCDHSNKTSSSIKGREFRD